MGRPASPATAEIYAQFQEQTTALHTPKVWEHFPKIFNQFLNADTWNIFVIISTIFFKTIRLLRRKKVMMNQLYQRKP